MSNRQYLTVMFVFLGCFSALNVSLLELPSVSTVGNEISVHHEVSDIIIFFLS